MCQLIEPWTCLLHSSKTAFNPGLREAGLEHVRLSGPGMDGVESDVNGWPRAYGLVAFLVPKFRTVAS